MIKAKVYSRSGDCIGFSITGHAGYAERGSDIVCASVTSAVQLTINGITEILKANANVEVLDNEISILLSDTSSNRSIEAINFLKAFILHISCLAEDFSGTIKITNVEV